MSSISRQTLECPGHPNILTSARQVSGLVANLRWIQPGSASMEDLTEGSLRRWRSVRTRDSLPRVSISTAYMIGLLKGCATSSRQIDLKGRPTLTKRHK